MQTPKVWGPSMIEMERPPNDPTLHALRLEPSAPLSLVVCLEAYFPRKMPSLYLKRVQIFGVKFSSVTRLLHTD